MKKTICAVTVSNFYLDRRKYCIKYLAVGSRKTGRAFWFVRYTGNLSIDKHGLEAEAIKHAITHAIPFIPNIRHGENVSKHDIDRLKKYGVAV